MHSSLAIFVPVLLALVSLTASRPPMDLIKTMARTTVARIKKIKDEHFQMSPEIDFGPDVDTPIEGLSSIIGHLGYLQVRLEVPPAQHLRQVLGDLDTLLSHLQRQAATLGCPQPKPDSPSHKADTIFPMTFNYLSLLELQRYLEKLCLNLDKLKSC